MVSTRASPLADTNVRSPPLKCECRVRTLAVASQFVEACKM